MLQFAALISVLQLAAPASARDRGEWLVAARGGALLPEAFSPLGASFVAGVEVGWAAPLWHHRFALAIDAQVSAPEASGATAQLAWHLTAREFAFGATIYYRHRVRRFTPYLGAGPRVIVLDVTTSGALAQSPIFPSRDTSAHVAGAIIPGFSVDAGPGQAFVELPACFSAAVTRPTGSFNLGSLALVFGYRVVF